MRNSRRQFAIDQEDPPGTAVASFSAADVLIRMRDDTSLNFDLEQIETEEVQAGSEHRPNLTGKKKMGLDLSFLLRGPGSLTTVPAVDRLFKAGMMVREDVKSIPIGAIAGGPLQDGETITGGASGATGKVFRDTADGASVLNYVVIAGVMDGSEEVTGTDSGATATMSGSPTDNGKKYFLADNDFDGTGIHHATVLYLLDGAAWEKRGALGELTFEFLNGNPCIVRQSYQGAFSDDTDAALFAGVTYPEQAVSPPRFLNAELYFGAQKPTDILDLTLNFPLGLFDREDANDAAADGLRFVDYNRGPPTIRIAPAFVKKATFAYFQNLFDGTTFAMRWRLGSTEGSIWDFFADEAQFVTAGIESREDLATIPLDIRCNGTPTKPEVVIWQR
jgi:hypothetical protein